MYFSIFRRVDPLISLARYAAIRLGICIMKTRATVERTRQEDTLWTMLDC